MYQQPELTVNLKCFSKGKFKRNMKNINQMLSEIGGICYNAQGNNYFYSPKNIGLREIKETAFYTMVSCVGILGLLFV